MIRYDATGPRYLSEKIKKNPFAVFVNCLEALPRVKIAKESQIELTFIAASQ